MPEGPKIDGLHEMLRFGRHSAALTTHLASSATVDPIEKVAQLLDEAKVAHFERFNPESACQKLILLFGQPCINQVVPERLLEIMIDVLAVYRQTANQSLSIVRAATDHCIERLGRLDHADKGPKLAARVAAMASELTGLLIQRGDAVEGTALLDRVFASIDFYSLEFALPDGRLHTMLRMSQWGHEVSGGGLGDVLHSFRDQSSRFHRILKAKAAHRPTDALTSIHQGLAALNRQALGEAKGADEVIGDFFEQHYRHQFELLSKAIYGSKSLRGKELKVTPSTAIAIALNVTLTATRLELPDAKDLIERSRLIYQTVNDAAQGSVLLQQANQETFKAARGLRFGKWASQVPQFDFTPNFHLSASQALLEQAAVLLDLIPVCLGPRVIAVTGQR